MYLIYTGIGDRIWVNKCCPFVSKINQLNTLLSLAPICYFVHLYNFFQPYYPFTEWDRNKPPVIQPDLDFLAPEQILSRSLDTSADLFSLGMLLYSVFNEGKTLFECKEQFSKYKENITEVSAFRVLHILSK